MCRKSSMGQTDLVWFFKTFGTNNVIFESFSKIYMKIDSLVIKNENRPKVTWDNYAQNGSTALTAFENAVKI